MEDLKNWLFKRVTSSDTGPGICIGVSNENLLIKADCPRYNFHYGDGVHYKFGGPSDKEDSWLVHNSRVYPLQDSSNFNFLIFN